MIMLGITPEKFIKALERVKVEGRWSLGLIINFQKSTEIGWFNEEWEKVVISGTSLTEKVIKKITVAFNNDKWVVLEIKNGLVPDMYNQLKLLSAQNRIQLPDGEILRMGDKSRIVVIIKPKILQTVLAQCPDFKYLFGPVITI